MNKEILRMVLLDVSCILTILVGIFLVICAIVNPRKLIIDNLTENDFKDKEKYVYSKRILLLIIGLLFIVNILLFWLNIFSKGDLPLMYSISILIMVIGNSIISKKYLLKKQNKL